MIAVVDYRVKLFNGLFQAIHCMRQLIRQRVSKPIAHFHHFEHYELLYEHYSLHASTERVGTYDSEA